MISQKQNTKRKKLNCKTKALRLLKRRAYFSWELATKLTTSDYTRDEVKKAIDLCKESMLLDDVALFKYHIGAMQKQKKWGRYKIRHVLLQKKIPQEIVEQMIERFYSHEVEAEMKKILIEQKEKEYLQDSPIKKKRKIHTFLYSRGF